MGVSIRDRTTVFTAIDEVAEGLINMVQQAPDLAVRVPATPDWTVGQVFAHVVTVAPRYCRGPRQLGRWTEHTGELCDLNADELATLDTTDITALVGRLRAAIDEFARLLDEFGDDQPSYRFHGGQRVRADVAAGILLGELVVHGHDIARALHAPWPIKPNHVELIQQGLTPILPGWLDPDRAANHTATYEVQLRGQGTHRFAFHNGALTMNPPGPWHPDVAISAEPATFLLIVYKRRSQWPAILTGKITARGRRAWLALTFANRFHQP
jgi:uncharacterized protein (TIGR03083 family)